MGFLSVQKILGTKKKLSICGMDEAGRGPWAGPVIACAIILPWDIRIRGLKDSKQLSAEKREVIYKKLVKKAQYGVGAGSVKEIDKLGIIKATNLAYIRALKCMIEKEKVPNPDHILIDGRDKFEFPIPFTSIIKGDEKVRIIACASIIAKVERDRMMVEYAKKYPKYGFEFHKGYGTERHQRALKKFGICKIHRQSYKPVADIMIKVKTPLKKRIVIPRIDLPEGLDVRRGM